MPLVTEKKTVFLLEADVYYEYYYSESHKTRPVLVLIHGFISSSYCYRKMLPYLVKKFDCLLIDLPGFGRSGKSKGFRYSFDNYANLVLALTKLLKIREAILIGHSMGGQVSLYTALKDKKLVKAIVLLNSSGYLKKVKRSYYYASYLPFADRFVKWWIEKKDYEMAIRQVVYNQHIVNHDVVLEYSRPLQEKQFFRSMLYLIRDREGDLAKEQLQQITQPCLILWGDEDRIIPLKIGRQLARDIPNNTFYCLKKTGHLTPEERPKQVIKHIFQFLKQHKVVL
ncbi:hydrolase [Alkalihalobacillus alcalophilus ATCC 27647 = CGMCC 1.3604]|nr:alpha/beta hydrolase [Alkalihalobacillus alcalophilus]MED1562823.1 alpha/beta hydrolase [Alkalihalobacillus alcalophilus]THG90470.1 hydrolase [Alkalihalobacillus alcalophilus ATCC 27647 = CGMCC 1.3604]